MFTGVPRIYVIIYGLWKKKDAMEFAKHTLYATATL